MPRPKNAAFEAAANLAPFIEDAARTHYDGQAWQGFKFWALSHILIDTELSDDELKQSIAIDGRGDLGLDGYFEDSDEQVLTLVQSKYHVTPQATSNDVIASFHAAMPARLLHRDVVVASSNEVVADAHRAIRDAIANQWTLRFVFLVNGWLTPEGRAYAEANRTTQSVYDSVEVLQELEVYDSVRLHDLYLSHLVPSSANTDVELDLTGPFPSAHHEITAGGIKVLVASVPAAEIVGAFRRHKYGLFRLNPRGPLKNRTNKQIKETLQDPNKRQYFYLFNNGITALCESYRVDGDRIIVRGFQIVNGCQTTVTLNSVAPIVESDRNIAVSLRLIEGPGNLSHPIATATNTQTRLTAADFKANDALQEDLKRQFNATLQPIFYEKKRGDWDMEPNKERYRLPEGVGYRRLKMKDVAQATLAFLGEPGRAKDRSRDIFESAEVYRKVFPPGVRAAQLLLPVRMYEMASELCKAWASVFPGAPYARFCLVALAATRLPRGAVLPPPSEAASLTANRGDLEVGLKKAQSVIAGLTSFMENYPGHREFFRSEDYFEKLLVAYRSAPD